MTENTLKSDFEEIAVYVLPYDHVVNNNANSNKNGKHSVSDTIIAPMV